MSGPTTSCLERQQAEVALLEAMYPEQVTWYSSRSELQYKSGSGPVLTLRLPANYPEAEKPTVLTAVGADNRDISAQTKAKLKASKLPLGDEAVDAILQGFEDVLEEGARAAEAEAKPKASRDLSTQVMFRTVIIWLHHLLNTNKRKLATHPSSAAANIVGVTKPGYPGVLIFSGPVDDVDLHVTELKHQRWQAFQVRFEVESTMPWKFTHADGIREVESMSDVSQAISQAGDREAFLKAVHIK